MLVLTRKPNQQLHIGNDIVITVVKVRGNTIRLGIEAPKDVRVIRSELEPKPATDSSALNQVDASGSAVEADGTSEADAAASSDDAQEAADAQVLAAATVVLQARIQQPASSPAKASPLKRFTAAKRPLGVYAERNLEDCPLCHRAPQGPRASQGLAGSAQRPGGLHSYLAAKHNAPRDKQSPTSGAHSKLAESTSAVSTKA